MVRFISLFIVACSLNTFASAKTAFLLECKADKDADKNPIYKIHRYTVTAPGTSAEELEIEKLVKGKAAVQAKPTLGMAVNDGELILNEKKEVASYTLIERQPNGLMSGLVHYSNDKGGKTFVIKLVFGTVDTDKVLTDYTCTKVK